jgi:pimeloyl-ACP methyl ester carboxylesterase
MTDPILRRTAGDGVEIALAVWEGKEKTVLCVHGISGSCRCWDNVAEALISGSSGSDQPGGWGRATLR